MLRLLRRTGRLLLLPSKYPIILRVSSFTSYRHSHPKNVQLVLQELKSDVASFTTHVQTCLATNQVVAGCEKLLQKVESTFCNKICPCCAFYRPNANLFCSKLRNATVRRDSRTVLSNQKSVFTQLTVTFICCKTDSNVGSKTRNMLFKHVRQQSCETSCTCLLPVLP